MRHPALARHARRPAPPPPGPPPPLPRPPPSLPRPPMTAVAHRKRAARGQGQLLREEIIAAAERLLIERGSEDAVSIRAIADAVGVTPPSIYMHFADKDELFMAVCEARFDE